MADDDVLSDDEIEALLDDDEGGDAPAPEDETDPLESVRSFYNQVADTVENILSTVIDREVESRLIECNLLEKSELEGNLDGDEWVVVTSELGGAISGTARYVLPFDVAHGIARVMMGEEADDAPEEFTEAYESAVVEIFNQLVNSLATELNNVTGEEISLEPPESSVIETGELLERVEEDEFLWVEYTLSIEELFDSGAFFEIQPSSIVDLIADNAEESEPEPAAEPQPQPEPQTAEPQTAEPQPSPEAGQGEQKEAKSVDFPQFEATEGEEPAGDINLLMDVPMEVSVELGRTKLRVKEILDLGAGSIIELDRLAGEPVDLLINGRLVARGEVVVIDENFGVRVTSVVSAMERLRPE